MRAAPRTDLAAATAASSLGGDGNAGGASRGWGRARRSRLEDVVRHPDVRYCSPRIILGQEEVVSEVKPVYRRAVLGAPARLV